LAHCYDWQNNRDQALLHSNKAIYYVKRMIIGLDRTNLSYDILLQKSACLYFESRFIEAKNVFEECYNLCTVAFHPEHPLVLNVGNRYVHILLSIGENYDAERFARVSYESATRNDENKRYSKIFDIANAEETLAQAIYQLILEKGKESGDIVEAAALAKEALLMKGNAFGSNHNITTSTKSVLRKL
jgi:hypothetical protein